MVTSGRDGKGVVGAETHRSVSEDTLASPPHPPAHSQNANLML